MASARATLIAAAVAALAALAAAVISIAGNHSIKNLEAQFAHSRDSTQFDRDRLSRLYLPVSMHLKITKTLFDRYFEETTNGQEKVAIEHALRDHNSAIREALVTHAGFLEPSAPQSTIDDLLEHLMQWETVYKLKYEYKVWEGPVFAGIEEFGYRGFPEGVDKYFHKEAEELRTHLHAKYQ